MFSFNNINPAILHFQGGHTRSARNLSTDCVLSGCYEILRAFANLVFLAFGFLEHVYDLLHIAFVQVFHVNVLQMFDEQIYLLFVEFDLSVVPRVYLYFPVFVFYGGLWVLRFLLFYHIFKILLFVSLNRLKALNQLLFLSC